MPRGHGTISGGLLSVTPDARSDTHVWHDDTVREMTVLTDALRLTIDARLWAARTELYLQAATHHDTLADAVELRAGDIRCDLARYAQLTLDAVASLARTTELLQVKHEAAMARLAFAHVELLARMDRLTLRGWLRYQGRRILRWWKGRP